MRNSGSDRLKFAIFFRRRMKSDVFACVHARCASSKMTDMIVWCARGADAFISEVVDVLNERLHSLPDRAFSFSVADACQFVAGKGLLKNRHQWTVSREVNCPRFS